MIPFGKIAGRENILSQGSSRAGSWKSWSIALLSLGLCWYALASYSRMVDEIGSLKVENRELLFREASLKRRENIFRPQGVNWDAVERASRYFGTPESVIYALRRTENGGETAELGYHGKSEAVTNLVDVGLIGLEDTQYCEASRRYTALAWEYVTQPDHWKEFSEYASKTYTGGPKAKWKAHAKSVRHFRQEIQKSEKAKTPK